MRYTDRQTEKHERQKYIACLGKITRNLFRMFRDEKTTVHYFKNRFSELLACLNEMKKIRLDSEYLKKTETYIRRLSMDIRSETFDSIWLNKIREAEMSNLNRLQKLKNKTAYKKAKYRGNAERDGWE